MVVWIMTLCSLLTPGIMLIAGRMMWKRPPRKINGIFGYRTKRSMQNMDTWTFAHDFCGRLWWKIGWIMLGVSALALSALRGGTDTTFAAGCVALMTGQCVVLIASIFPTERALERTFSRDGTRKTGDHSQE